MAWHCGFPSRRLATSSHRDAPGQTPRIPAGALEQRGALFLHEIRVRAHICRLTTSSRGLAELVAGRHVTSDGFGGRGPCSRGSELEVPRARCAITRAGSPARRRPRGGRWSAVPVSMADARRSQAPR
jgi:hypothetical protein